MTHIPFQHSYAKGGSACYIEAQATDAAADVRRVGAAARGLGETEALGAPSSVACSTLAYSDASSAGSTESFATDSDGSEVDFIPDSPSTSSSSDFEEVRFDEIWQCQARGGSHGMLGAV